MKKKWKHELIRGKEKIERKKQQTTTTEIFERKRILRGQKSWNDKKR